MFFIFTWIYALILFKQNIPRGKRMKNINILSEDKKYTIEDYLAKNRPEKNKKGKKVTLFLKNMSGDVLDKISFSSYDDTEQLSIPKKLISEEELSFLEDYGEVYEEEGKMIIIGKIKHLSEIDLENIMTTIE